MTKRVNIPTGAALDAADLSASLSMRLKSMRTAAGLTLDALSKRSTVSKGMLVEIERGTANPSIGTLCKVAAAFGTSVADILTAPTKATVQVIAEDEVATLWTGELGGTAQLVAGTTGPDMIELWRWRMMPGEVYEAQAHTAGTTELLLVEKGQLLLTVGASQFELMKGMAAVAKTDEAHSYANRARGELVFTMTVAELLPSRAAR